MPYREILEQVNSYYSDKVKQFGPVAQGADWKSHDSQVLRFDQLCKLIPTAESFSILDYGCGYAALVSYLRERGYAFDYTGFDISEEMLAEAGKLYGGDPHIRFFRDESLIESVDYTVASGIFNVKLETSTDQWTQYILHSLDRMNQFSQKGFAFNVLTSYSDAEYRRPHLYYADPLFFFDYCKRNFSKYVTLLHDYPLWEFTLFVRR